MHFKKGPCQGPFFLAKRPSLMSEGTIDFHKKISGRRTWAKRRGVLPARRRR